MSTLSRLISKKLIYTIIGIIAVGSSVWFFWRAQGESDLETFNVARGDVIQKVSVSGKVKAAESVDLGFDKSGRVSKVNAGVGERVSVGETLVEIYNADLISDLREAEANLKSELAKLSDIKNGAREEDINVAKARVDEARQTLKDRIEDSYTKADDAIHNKVDQFFSNPRSSSPQINFSLFAQLESDLESGRVQVENRFKVWNSSLIKLNSDSNLYVFSGEAQEAMKFIKSYLDTVAIALSSLEPNGSITQATIDSYRADVSTARTNVNAGINNITTATSNLKIAESELVKAEAGSTLDEIQVQEAAVERARAVIDNIEAQISKTRIVSPLRGVVSRQDAKVGQIVSASSPVVSVISDAKFQIEANLPEAEVSKVKVGDAAELTLDAFGDEKFEMVVISIDPAETVVEGISTYKIKLEFKNNDERIKSGLTANLDILAQRRHNVLYIPIRAVINEDGKKLSRVQRDDGRVDEVEIQTGLIGNDGRIEVISGLEEGVKIVISKNEV